MQPEVSKRLDQLVEQFKKTIAQQADHKDIDPASLTIRVKFKLKQQQHGVQEKAALVAPASICFDCSDPVQGCVKIPC